MSLKEAIDRYSKGRVIGRTVTSRTSHVASIVSGFEARFEKLSVLPPDERNQLLVRLKAVAIDGNWASLAAKDLKRAADFLFDGEEQLARLPVFLKGYLKALAVSASRNALARLVSVYCIHFDPGDPAIETIARFLVLQTGKLPPIWAECHATVRIFEPAMAPSRIAAAAVDADNPRDALSKLGLSGRRGASGLATQAFCAVVDLLSRRLERTAQADDVAKILRWGSTDGKTLVYDGARSALAHALLLPWHDRTVPQGLRREIERFLLATFKDPRIHPGQWASVQDDAKRVMRRWLTENSLEQFLRVVDRVALAHQWRYRRAFWGAYFQQGHILDAWVAFARDGAMIAHAIAAEPPVERAHRCRGARREEPTGLGFKAPILNTGFRCPIGSQGVPTRPVFLARIRSGFPFGHVSSHLVLPSWVAKW